MSREEARGHVRAAQEAEIAGNKEGAVRHLERAALVYVRSRQMTRAVQMYKHALRLTPERTDLRTALTKAEEWAAEEEANPTALVMEPSDDLARALDEATQTIDPTPPSAPLPALPLADEGRSGGPPDRGPAAAELDSQEFIRGPVRAPEGIDAWCSFCCRPTREVGPLAQGPAGAFICSGCLGAATDLLGRAPTVLPRHEVVTLALGSAPAAEWSGPPMVLELGLAALEGRGPLVVVGDAGVGKTTLLSALAALVPGARRVDLALGDAIPEGTAPLLIDHLEAGNGSWAALEKRAFVAALRASSEAHPLELMAGGEALSLPLASAELPVGFPTTPVVALPAMDKAALQGLLEAQQARQSGVELGASLREALVARALKLGRGAHGLMAELAAVRALRSRGVLEHVARPKRSRKRRQP